MKSLLLALALLAGLQTKGADARVGTLVAALGDGSNAQTRSEAYMTLMREKPGSAIPLIADALPGYDVQGQEYGLWVLAAFPLEQSRLALHKLAGDKSALLAAGAATQLWRLGEVGMLDTIVKAFARKDAPLEARRAMLRRIFLIGDPRLSSAVRAWIAPETDSLVLEDTLYHLLNVEDAPARAKAVELAATPGLPAGSRAACAAFLLALGEDAQGLALAELLAGDDGTALARLQRFLVRAPRVPEAILVAVAQLAEKAAPGPALTAVSVLALHAGPRQIPVLERLLGSPDLMLAKAALDALQRRGVSISHETLVRMLESKEDLRVLAAADALRRMDDLSGFERVLAVQQSGGAAKAEALRVLAKFRKRASLRPLVEALDDADASVRLAAEQGLYELLRNLFPYRRFAFATSGLLAQATPDKRAEGVRALRAWCAANLAP